MPAPLIYLVSYDYCYHVITSTFHSRSSILVCVLFSQKTTTYPPRQADTYHAQIFRQDCTLRLIPYSWCLFLRGIYWTILAISWALSAVYNQGTALYRRVPIISAVATDDFKSDRWLEWSRSHRPRTPHPRSLLVTYLRKQKFAFYG